MTDDKNRSPLATQIPDLVPDAPRLSPVYGLCVHTSGRGILSRAKRLGLDPLEVALAYYQKAEYSAHYVIDHDGDLFQITADDRRVSHIGLTPGNRLLYLSGRWKKQVSKVGLEAWMARWGQTASPASLYPSRYPNTDYVGAECLPLPDASYTDQQHAAVAALACDLAQRHSWPSGWAESSRLLGHEDLSPLTRWDRGGGWDPGARRGGGRQRFHWEDVTYVIARVLA